MKKQVVLGYTNEKPGDETSPLVPVYELTEKQFKALVRGIELSSQIEGFEKKLDRAREELAVLRTACSHHVFNDTEGFPQTTRYCAICGEFMGFV
jgi:hypothetical protein